jgi:hypothetical protein
MNFSDHPGNIHLAILIDQLRNAYQSKNRLDKTAISNEVVCVVKASNGRFLKRCEDDIGGWTEVSDDLAREKVSHGFRTKRKGATW